MFGITKTFISLGILHRELNQTNSIYFLKKFHEFINDAFRVVITLRNRNIWYLFRLKDKSDYESCYINKGDCSCGTRYIVETRRNAEVKWNWHIIQVKIQNHWNTFKTISTTVQDHGILQASFISPWKPDLNKQSDFKRLVLYKNGVTRSNYWHNKYSLEGNAFFLLYNLLHYQGLPFSIKIW